MSNSTWRQCPCPNQAASGRSASPSSRTTGTRTATSWWLSSRTAAILSSPRTGCPSDRPTAVYRSRAGPGRTDSEKVSAVERHHVTSVSCNWDITWCHRPLHPILCRPFFSFESMILRLFISHCYGEARVNSTIISAAGAWFGRTTSPLDYFRMCLNWIESNLVHLLVANLLVRVRILAWSRLDCKMD